MADVQPENGFLRIATELMDEIIRRDFSKRQLAILHFVIRLSYGCQKKDCVIEKFNMFEIAGINKVDIKKELKFLRECFVINWDETTMIFSINKDYEKWQITPSKGFEKEKFDHLIHQNIKRKVSKTLTNERKEVSKTLTTKKQVVSKILTFKSEKVSKTLTMKLVKYELRYQSITCLSKAHWVRKDILKISFKDINNHHDDKEKKSTENNPFVFYEQNGFGTIPPSLHDEINYWFDGKFFDEPDLIIIESMKEAVRNNKRSWSYCNRCLINWSNLRLRTLNEVKTQIKSFNHQINKKEQKSQQPQQKYNYGF
ncbi:MAG TPA: DnaD domain protein [Bacillus bacterium]|nr:DnaD domain protein [Bacillus sp. (in: firmicutes)]